MSWEKIEDHLFYKHCVEGEDKEFENLMVEHDAEIRAKAIDDFVEKLNDFLHIEDISYYTEDIAKMANQLKEKIEFRDKVYTGHNDCNGNPIYVGDIIKEGCNGLEAAIVWNNERGSYWLEGLGEGYGIENAEIEWCIIDSYTHENQLDKGTDDIEQDL